MKIIARGTIGDILSLVFLGCFRPAVAGFSVIVRKFWGGVARKKLDKVPFSW